MIQSISIHLKNGNKFDLFTERNKSYEIESVNGFFIIIEDMMNYKRKYYYPINDIETITTTEY
jgi:hypothetical protein